MPEVLAYNCSNNNELGFEWILMEKMPGKALGDVWDSLSMVKKEMLVKNLAHHSTELFSKRFTGIGNLYLAGMYPSSNQYGVK